MRKHFDVASLTVIIVTFVLFIVALFTKGFTHDLLLEVGIFLCYNISQAYYDGI